MSTPLRPPTPQASSIEPQVSVEEARHSSSKGLTPGSEDFDFDGVITGQLEAEHLTNTNDILHTITHNFEDERNDDERQKEATPELLDELETGRVRERLLDMGVVQLVDGKETVVPGQYSEEREIELARMVLRLTDPSLSSLPTQLVEQSRTISELVRQRDLIVQRQQEQQEFWEAERASWARVVGALTTRRFADGTHRGDVLERDNINLISENRVLKAKLQDQQSRIDSLEGELRTLRPLLLLRPTSPLRGTTVLPTTQSPPKAKTIRNKDSREFSDEEVDLHHSKKPHNPTKHATTGDARAEHLLLATRKLGKERIARLLPTSMIPQLSLPRGAAGAGVPTPSVRPGFFNASVNPYSVGVPLPTALPTGYTLPNLQALSTLSPSSTGLVSPIRQAAGGSGFAQGVSAQNGSPTRPPLTPNSATHLQAFPYPPTSPSKAPNKPATSSGRGRGARPSTPSRRAAPTTPPKPAESTPSALDHLITASRILGEPSRRAETLGNAVDDGSPLQKRRKINDSGKRSIIPQPPGHLPTTSGTGSSTSTLGRTMSALDVLAEQAAVVIAQSPLKGPVDVPSDIEEEPNLESDHSQDEETPRRPSRTRRQSPEAKRGRSSGNAAGDDATYREARIGVSRASSHASSSVGSGLRSPIAIRSGSVDEDDGSQVP